MTDFATLTEPNETGAILTFALSTLGPISMMMSLLRIRQAVLDNSPGVSKAEFSTSDKEVSWSSDNQRDIFRSYAPISRNIRVGFSTWDNTWDNQEGSWNKGNSVAAWSAALGPWR
jgi:hypothetical protein